jgi:Domain of unknown function (DUF4159)/Aerotolerance regulator N-terminal
MTFGALAFLNPWLLAGLVTLPVIYWLLRAVPPRPATIEFPPTRILVGLENDEKTADKTPWWLTLIRLLAATLVILGLAEPVLNPAKTAALKGSGPVVIVADNGWAAASRWPERARMIDRLIGEAENAHRPVIVLGTATASKTATPKIEAPAEARNTAAALKPEPFAPDRTEAITALEAALASAKAISPSIVWLHDGIDHTQNAAAIAEQLTKLAGNGSFAVLDESNSAHALGLAARLGEKGKLEALVMTPGGGARDGAVYAFSARGERLGEAQFKLPAGAALSEISFDLPLELRNQVARIEIPSERSAGAVSLIDAATQWHRVGLISGENREQAQPLLGPLYYIQRALTPYAELAVSKDSNLVQGLDGVLRQNVSVLMMADIGTLSGEAAKRVDEFVNRGGVLVRFAGPRLEKSGDELLPVALRAGGRSLGGALSWSSPQALATFDEASPFAGLTIPADVLVNRQVLADPSRLSPEVEIWARLKDGTPLVTATKHGNGKLVLFHVTANSDWSNLPISGLFVEMLRRLSTMGTVGASGDGTAATSGQDAAAAEAQNILPPIRMLDGAGALKAPPATAEPIKASALAETVPSRLHPPGYYGNGASPRAVNVLTPKSTLPPFPVLAGSVQHLNYENAASTPLKPWMLALGLALLFADIIAILILQAGGLKGLTQARGVAKAAMIALAVFGGAIAAAPSVRAQVNGTQTEGDVRDGVADPKAPIARNPGSPPVKLTNKGSFAGADKAAIDATSKVTFGYVVSGDRDTDDTSRTGLLGLAKVLESRTAVEPGEPAAVDISKDEIAFYPILYWPVLDTAEALPDAAIARIDAYMKEGGLIIFDTRDYGQGGSNTLPMAGKGGNALQRLLSKLDVPRLEPVPENHVVTKSFYLLRSFPGRWDGGQMWVEAISENPNDTHRARVADGVTSIIITSNDFAAAWALDERNRPIYPVVPGGEMQREMAYRSGVNIVMHALTGNYKADQVHVPALLERLGQ